LTRGLHNDSYCKVQWAQTGMGILVSIKIMLKNANRVLMYSWKF